MIKNVWEMWEKMKIREWINRRTGADETIRELTKELKEAKRKLLEAERKLEEAAPAECKIGSHCKKCRHGYLIDGYGMWPHRDFWYGCTRAIPCTTFELKNASDDHSDPGGER